MCFVGLRVCFGASEQKEEGCMYVKTRLLTGFNFISPDYHLQHFYWFVYENLLL